MKINQSWILAFPLLWLYAGIAYADYPIEVIELRARPLEEVLPLVRPLIGPDGTATGMGNNLVLKAAPQRVREIRQLLEQVDRPPRRLLISVGKQGERMRDESGYSAGADIRTGDGQVSINSPGYPVDESRVRIHVHDSDTRRSRSIGQQVQALEGRPAFIASGTQIPVQGVERYYRHGRLHERHVTRMHDASSGFYVLPRVSGEHVTLEIHTGAIHTQRADSVVRGRLGEWISLAGIDSSSSGSQGGPLRSHASRASVSQQVEVMVECLDCAANGTHQRPWPPALQGFE